MSRAPEAAKADADQPWRQNVLGKSGQEIDAGRDADLCAVGIGVGGVGPGDAASPSVGGGVMGGDAPRADSDAVDVGSEILQEDLRRAEGRLNADAPLPPDQGGKVPPKDG